MEMDFSHIRQNDKIGGIFSVDESGTFTSPELERIVQLKKKNEEFFSRARQLRKEMSAGLPKSKRFFSMVSKLHRFTIFRHNERKKWRLKYVSLI